MGSIDIILKNLDKIDATSKDPTLLEKSKNARQATLQYRDGYNKGVDSLKLNVSSVDAMQKAGDLVGNEAENFLEKQVQDYTDAKKRGASGTVLDQYVQRYIITTQIWATAFKIRMAERDERLYKDRTNYQSMLKLKGELSDLYSLLETATTDKTSQEAIQRARSNTDSYFKAAADWITNDTALNQKILPAMKAQGEEVVKLAMEAAMDNSKGMIGLQKIVIS